MKKYIQLTAGRGPVECARAVTLVARELLKDFPDAELVESEPHNTEHCSKEKTLPQHRFARPSGVSILHSCVGTP